MINHLELVVHRLLELVGGWMCALAMTVVVACAGLAFLALNLYKFDQEACLKALYRLNLRLSRAWGWLLAAGVLLMQVYGLTVLREGLMERLQQEDKARYIAADDQGGAPTTQRAPRVAFLETTTHTQRIVLPPQLTSLQALPGWSPEEARYGSSPAVNVQDELVKDDKTVVLNRTTEVQRWVPGKLLRSDVEVTLNFLDRSKNRHRQAYQADFSGRYTFQNPFPEARRFHFSFPLPDNSGTLAGFHFKVDGQDVPPQDIDRGMDTELELKPGQRVIVTVGYTNLGAQAWSYDVTGRREPIADFHLNIHPQHSSEIKFLRGSLYPTSSEGGMLSWNLQNQITSQSIQLYFPFVQTEQLVRNLYIFTPVAVLALVTLTLVWSRLRRCRVSAWTLVLVSVASCGGFALTSYLLSYIPLVGALAFSGAFTAVLQWRLLGNRLWLPVVVSAMAPFTFLAAGDTGLLLCILGLCALALTVHETIRYDED